MSYQSQLQQETQAKIDAAQDDATKQKLAEEARQNLAKKIKKLLNPFKIRRWKQQKLWVMQKALAL